MKSVSAAGQAGTRKETLVLKRLLPLVMTTFGACVIAGSSVAGSTQVNQFAEGPFPDEVCGISGTITLHGTSVFSEGAHGTFFARGTFWAVFTAATGKSATLFAAGPANQTSPPVIDEQLGTIT